MKKEKTIVAGIGLVKSSNDTTVYTAEGNIGDYSSWRSRIVGEKVRSLNYNCILGYMAYN